MLEVEGKQVLVDLGRAQIKAQPPIAIGDRLTVTGSEGRGGRKALRATRVVRGGETYDIAPARVVTPGRVPRAPVVTPSVAAP